MGVESEKITVIPYGVSDAFFAPPTFGCDPESGVRGVPYVLFVGTREARKGLSTLYAALRLLNAEHCRVRLVLAGQDGWGTERLMEEMRSDPTVELRDKPSDEELSHLYRDALALVYPSEMEGFGLPVAEAMACGCAVIASDLPSIREFAGDHPFYITPGDSANLATQIQGLLNGDHDVERRRATARDAVTSLRWDLLGDLTAKVLEQVSGVGPRPVQAPRSRDQGADLRPEG
jgi:glycosyltransferase involved in cell wall biosynthesis